MLKSRDAEFKVTTLEEDISLDFQSRLHFVERVEALSANMTETPATFGITVGRWR